MFTTLIDVATLATHLDDTDWVVIDCRFDLADVAKGERQYLEGHIPGARYAHLARDLSAAPTGSNGRHPMPTPEDLRTRFSVLGIAPGRQVVAYDGDTGMYAARLWWMLRYMGHESVAVLDGGFAAWTAAGHPTRAGREETVAAVFVGEPRPEMLLGVEEVVNGLDDAARLLVDARAHERYRGENETIDKVGGHIPGARNFFWQDNLTPDKTFKPASELRESWRTFLQERNANDVVMYCGSGVTACANLLAMSHAGLGGARLFGGSWSEWIADPSRPKATGDKP